MMSKLGKEQVLDREGKKVEQGLLQLSLYDG